MAFPQHPHQRPPPGHYNNSRPAQPTGWPVQVNDGYSDAGYNDYGHDNGQYQYGGYGSPQSYGTPQGPPRAQRGGYGPLTDPYYGQDVQNGRQPDHRGYDGRRYRGPGDERPRMASNPSNGTANRPPPKKMHARPAERQPLNPPPPQDKMGWDNPFPTFPSKEKRKNSAPIGIEKDMAAMEIRSESPNVRPPDRPHTSQERRHIDPRSPQEETQYPARSQHATGRQPMGPIRREPRPGYPIERAHTDPQMERARMEGNAPPPMPPVSRSATVPAQTSAFAPPPAMQAAYPGQNTYQEPIQPLSPSQSSFTQNTIPGSPRTTGGARPPISFNEMSRTMRSVPRETQPHEPHDSSDQYHPEDVLDDYFESPLAEESEEPDMPNFDAIGDPNKAPAIDESLPGLEEYISKPSTATTSPPSSGQYAPYKSQFEAEEYPARSQPDPRARPWANGYENSGFQFDIAPNASPATQVQNQGNAPYSGGGYGSQPPAQPQNPDSLPHHPAPFRPGLDQSRPPPVRQYSNGAATAVSPPPVAPQNLPTGNASPPSPVTREELDRLQQMYRGRPSDFKTHLLYAKKLAEASVVLVGDDSHIDPKMRAKVREKYVMDAYKIVKKLAHDGYPDAQFYLADCYGQGLLGLQSDPKEAFQLYHSAAKQGHAQSAYRVAVCSEIGYEEGGGTKRDPLKAVQWYKRAAALGDPPAMYKMGMILLKGLLGQTKNRREGISWLKRAAERADAENPHALHELALLYESATNDDIIIRDEEYAKQLLHQAADLGYKFSQFRLGATYEYGLMGCPVDPRLSIVYYTRAAAQGEHQSELSLSGWYLTGAEGILQQSDTEAYLWARKAASAGLPKAEYAMGYFSEVGIGVPANLDDAKRWYWRAAAQGFPKARERLEELKRGGGRMQKTRLSRSNVHRQNDGDCVLM